MKPADHLTWAQATDLSLVQSLRSSLDSDALVPKKVKFDAIKHHHLLLRCEEEVQMLCEEMRSCLAFYVQDWNEIIKVIRELRNTTSTKFNNGALAILQLARLKCETKLTTLVTSFGPYIEVDPLPVDQFLALHDDVHSCTGTSYYCINLNLVCSIVPDDGEVQCVRDVSSSSTGNEHDADSKCSDGIF